MDKKSAFAAAMAGLAMTAAGCGGMMQKSSAPSSSTTAAPAAPMAKGECSGVNSCKGTGECGGEGHSCAGQNSCKGQGWISLTKSDCDARGGTFKKG